jgi:phenylpropionate dioxygenase-like ring-hydroxylating dioxygenase large terminal subunit
MVPNEVEMLSRMWFPVARVQDLDGGPFGATLLGRRLVVYRAGGEVAVAQDRCPHRGGRLSNGRTVDAVLECPYHGWRWNAEGGCELVPSQPGARPAARLATVPSRERAGLVWATLESPLMESPAIPETEDAEGGWEFGLGDWFDVSCGLRTITENFRDSSHFAFVHRETFGDVNPEVPAYTVHADGRRLSWTLPIRFGSAWSVNGGDRDRSSKYRFGETEGEEAEDEEVLLHYRFDVPSLSYVYTEQGGARRLVCQAAAPLDTASTHCRVFFLVAADAEFRRRHGDIATQVAIETRVFSEDVPIVEGLDPTEAPLDLEGQAHVRADRYSVAYRRLYAELLEAFRRTREEGADFAEPGPWVSADQGSS